jgi:hypothetical protein
MKTNTTKIIIWILVVTIFLAITFVLLLVPIFTVDLDLNKCSNISLVQINDERLNFGLDEVTPEDGCVKNSIVIQTAILLYLTKNDFDFDNVMDIPENDVIKVNNLGIGNKFCTVSFNVRKLFEIDDDDLTILKLNKNLIGTIYRF